MNIECRFSKACNRFLTDDCSRCLHNRRRNGPKSFYDNANDKDLDGVEKLGDAYFAHKVVGSFTNYICPACESSVYICPNSQVKGEHFRSECEYCGLPVIVMF